MSWNIYSRWKVIPRNYLTGTRVNIDSSLTETRATLHNNSIELSLWLIVYSRGCENFLDVCISAGYSRTFFRCDSQPIRRRVDQEESGIYENRSTPPYHFTRNLLEWRRMFVKSPWVSALVYIGLQTSSVIKRLWTITKHSANTLKSSKLEGNSHPLNKDL